MIASASAMAMAATPPDANASAAVNGEAIQPQCSSLAKTEPSEGLSEGPSVAAAAAPQPQATTDCRRRSSATMRRASSSRRQLAPIGESSTGSNEVESTIETEAAESARDVQPMEKSGEPSKSSSSRTLNAAVSSALATEASAATTTSASTESDVDSSRTRSAAMIMRRATPHHPFRPDSFALSRPHRNHPLPQEEAPEEAVADGSTSENNDSGTVMMLLSDATNSLGPQAAAPATTDSSTDPESRRSAMLKKGTSHRSFFASTRHHTLQRSRGDRRLFSDNEEAEDNNAEEYLSNSDHNIVATGGAKDVTLEDEYLSNSDHNMATGGSRRTSRTTRRVTLKESTPDQQGPVSESTLRRSLHLDEWKSRTKKFFSQYSIDHHNSSNSDLGEESATSKTKPPDSDVERIVQRLEKRAANRVHVPAEVKSRFLRLCKEASKKRRQILESSMLESTSNNDNKIGSGKGLDSSNRSGGGLDSSNRSGQHRSTETTTILSCILRSDVIRIRKAIRLEVEGRTRLKRVADGIKAYFGFRCHCKVLLHVLNRAVDLIDESRPKSTVHRRRSSNFTGIMSEHSKENRSNRNLASSFNSSFSTDNGRNYPQSSLLDGIDETKETNNLEEIDENDWFYYKDFAFYSLKIESKYPWMRNAGVFSILLTSAFYLFAPILWCSVLNDRNICAHQPEEKGGWLSALFFASATMSTVGYGDITVFVGSDDPDTPEPETWRIFLATCFMILSLVVSVVGFQAGLDSHFHPFRRRLDIFGRRVYEILQDANIVKGKHCKHDEMLSRMRWSKFSQLAEICLIFLILNLIGVFAVQLSLLVEKEDEFGDRLSLSWMESFYWAVQTTTTIGYGDISTPESLRWFLLVYLAISTYFVGSAFGKLGELSKKLESMSRLYLWQQQEASYTMLHDFSGRPNGRDRSDADNNDILDFEPEIDQFEFTIASLVVMGKITSDDVRPILEKFKRLSGENSNKITSSDVSGPMRKKKNETSETNEGGEHANNADKNDAKNDINTSSSKSSTSGALVVGKKIAKAFREEILSSSAANDDHAGVDVVKEEKKETKKDDYSDFRIPKNTYAIAIDDSKIQRKLLSKIFENAGIKQDRCTICGDGYSEVMGFEDYVVAFMENHDGYVFMIVDENLDVVDESSDKHETISGSQCVENIRRRLPPETERRMFALIRSANDSSSDIAIYNSRAHGFLPKAPIKREKMNETLAPLWRGRFPPSEFGESIGILSRKESEAISQAEDIACTPFDIANKISEIDALFKRNAHVTESHLIHDEMHELKGDLLTMNSTISTDVVAQINLVQVTQSPETLLDRWQCLRDSINQIILPLQKNFRLPKNVYAIAIDDSKIQRKLLAKFFGFLDIPSENCTIVGDGYEEVKGFEDLVVKFMKTHKDDYVFMIVDENLDVVDESTHESIFVSGSQCVENIRQRLPVELEKRMLALVRSANDSTTDVAIYNKRAHGFLPKAPIRREKVYETLAPLWMKRFPPTEFVDSALFDTMTDETTSLASDEVACTPFDIAQKLVDIESLFKKEAHFTDMRIIYDQLHELKGDLLTLNSDSSMISILGMINLMLLGHNQSPEVVIGKWHALRDRIYAVINSLQSNGSEGQSSTTIAPRIKLLEVLRSKNKDYQLSSSFTRESPKALSEKSPTQTNQY